MGTRMIVPSVCLAACFALALPARGQTAVDPLDIVQFPATPPSKPARRPSAPAPATQPTPIALRSLPAVAAAQQTPSRWQDAAKQAEDRLTDPALQKKLDEQLNALAPKVAGVLLDQPTALVVVSIAVYTDPASGHQQSVAVAFEGLDSSLNPGFFPRLLADMPFPADQSKRQNRALAFDPAASSCMIYYLSGANLDAADIAQATLKQDLGVVLATPALAAPAPGVVADAAPPDIPQRQPLIATETRAQAQHAQGVQDRAVTDDNSAYDSSGIDTSDWGEPPVYQPHWITIDIPETSGESAPAESPAPAARNVGAASPTVGATPKGKKNQ